MVDDPRFSTKPQFTAAQLIGFEEELDNIREDIESANGDVDAARARRTEFWKYLDEIGVRKVQMARWSDCDPMIVTRALKGE